MDTSKKYFGNHNGQKSQLIYVVFALFFGAFGIHNFYANRWGRGLIQLLLTVGTGFVGAVVSSLWSVINIFTIETDGDGRSFELNLPAKYICGVLGIFKYLGEIVVWGILLFNFLTGTMVHFDGPIIGKRRVQEVSERIVTPSETIYKTTETTTVE